MTFVVLDVEVVEVATCVVLTLDDGDVCPVCGVVVLCELHAARLAQVANIATSKPTDRRRLVTRFGLAPCHRSPLTDWWAVINVWPTSPPASVPLRSRI